MKWRVPFDNPVRTAHIQCVPGAVQHGYRLYKVIVLYNLRVYWLKGLRFQNWANSLIDLGYFYNPILKTAGLKKPLVEKYSTRNPTMVYFNATDLIGY